MNKQQNTQQPVAWVVFRSATEYELFTSEYNARQRAKQLGSTAPQPLYTAPPVTDELPVRYYKDGGITYAVYGSSSINYVEKLRAMLSASQKGE